MTLTLQQIKEKAHISALEHDPFTSRKSTNLFWKRNEAHLEEIRLLVTKLEKKESTCTPPAEDWLLDNIEFIEEQYLTIKQSLTNPYIKSLPHLEKTGESRILSVCNDYVKITEGFMNKDGLSHFIHAYQEVSVLSIAELWAIPMMMRLALIRYLSKTMETITERHEICVQVDNMLAGIETADLSPEKLTDIIEKAGYEIPLSGPVAVHLVKHLRERADYSATVGEWLVCKLDNDSESLDQILSYEYQLQARYQVTTGHLITSMRKLSRLDWSEKFEELSMVEQTLNKELAGVYPKMDFSSRETLRNSIERLSRRLKVPENLVASQARELADDVMKRCEGNKDENLPKQAIVSYYLLEAEGLSSLRKALKMCSQPKKIPENILKKRAPESFFSLSVVLFLIVFTALIVIISQEQLFSIGEWILLGLVLFIPASEWAIVATHWIIEKITRPIPLLKYDFSEGVPEDAQTMVVIPVIWSTTEEVEKLTERLELHYLANRDQHIHFALLGDFKSSNKQHSAKDDELLKVAKKELNRLMETYPEGSFHLFHRKRVWNDSENIWMGWERKRGKLVEFIHLIKGKSNTSYHVSFGNRHVIQEIRYLITLDADTELPLESAKRMIGTIHLPFNRPKLNQTKTRVIDGYGVLQPRIGMSYDVADRSRFASLWAAEPGVDPYSFTVSDPYQDCLGEGIFTGKGIIDVDSFHEVLSERVPENRLLSHDLLEGGFLRAGLLSDIELVDGHPIKYMAYQKRLHRWVRGDWQLLLWLLPKVRNQKGELQPVDLSSLTKWQIIDNLRRSLLSPVLFLMLLAGLTVLPGSALFWTILFFATLFLPVIRKVFTINQKRWYIKAVAHTTAQVLVTMITLPFQTVVLLDAIIRTIYRLTYSKRRLLEWTPAADVDRFSEKKDSPILSGVASGYIIVGIFLIAVMVIGNAFEQFIMISLTTLWVIAPFVINWLNSPINEKKIKLSELEKQELSILSKEIWSFYEDYVTKQDNWLPPDNVQFNPPRGIAHRTSPTNIGLYLCSIVAAKDMGFISLIEMMDRMDNTIMTIEKMEKWQGHLYNWYDTTTLIPLHPKYVSTVDSGNFVGSLITVNEAILEWLGSYNYTIDPSEEPEITANAHQLALSEELAPVNINDYRINKRLTNKERLKQLHLRLNKLIYAVDFRPLYNHKSKLFSLGYHEERLSQDDVLYDLMASEARQASFIAIAFGQVSVSHWNALGRTMTKVDNEPVLLSWSGTMFEYLMPNMFMRSYRRSLWDHTYHSVVQRQIDYAKQRGIPFGISESGYYAFDYQMNYQYRAFGTPGLGFKRGLEQDLVVSPYATVLALPFAKNEGVHSLKELEKLNGRGKYGFYEAIDFTKKRLPRDSNYKVIQSYMAHHQGMSLLTIANLLLDDVMIDRFHRNKSIRAAELLLQERMPKQIKVIEHHAMNRKHEHYLKPVENISSKRRFPSVHTKTPEMCVLSNGKFSTFITTTGSGFSQYKGHTVSRWRQDPVRDSWGSYMYIRDTSNDRIWSPSYQPVQAESEEQTAEFELGRAVFVHKNNAMETYMEVCVSPERNAEVRRLTLVNTSEETKVIEVTTFSEIALANKIADETHPAFSKLFIRTSYDSESSCLLAGRRPREVNGESLWAAHSLVVNDHPSSSLEYETDRSTFIGRGNNISNPQGIRSRLKGKTGAVADPAFVMKKRVTIQSGEKVQLAAITAVSETCEDALETVRYFTSNELVDRTYQMSWNRSEIELRNLQLSNKEANIFQTLAGQILYCPPLRKEREKYILLNRYGQSKLWAFGISGDRPIILVRVEHINDMKFVVHMAMAHEYLRRHGILFDLVIFNESEEGYHQKLQEALQQTVEHGVGRFGAQMTGVHVIEATQLDEDDRGLFISVARLTLHARGPTLESQLNFPKEQSSHIFPEKLIPEKIARKEDNLNVSLKEKVKGLLFYNGWGGFSENGKEYRILMKSNNPLPAPWINVLSNPSFGCLISELGTGYTWWKNSSQCKITPWSNDPVLDPPAEKLFLRDEETGDFWSGTSSSNKREEKQYFVTHGRGFTNFEHETNGIEHKMTVYVPLKDPIKIIKVKVKNQSFEPKRLSLTYYAEWVLGVQRENNSPFIVTDWQESLNILTARNTYQETFRDANAFLGIFTEGVMDSISWTADRNEFIGRNGDMEEPASMQRNHLSGRTGTFHENCGAVQTKISLQPYEEQEVYILIGCDESEEKVSELVQKYRQSSACDQALKEVQAYWERSLDQIQVQTPSLEMDILLNGWLGYQTLACRMWGRTAFYQSGGAYGYRDQLQDSLSLLHSLPEITKQQILLHAAHQYVEGDVQHWWHEETEKGIRTMFSDDLLWLPYCVSRYIEHTGDISILDETVPFLQSEPLQEGEHERYESTVVSSESGTIYDHCLRAINKALERIGEHGLPLIGVGDWNDGMNLVGAEGRGESVWLGWFMCDILTRFEKLSYDQGNKSKAQFFVEVKDKLAIALNKHGWDGHWYRRAFTDKGNWIGSTENDECRIDAIAQSWSVISGAAPKERAVQAMESFNRELVDRELSVIQLLTPPFDKTDDSPGYIQGYPPGIRENGAQYTHGVIWSIIAYCQLGKGNLAMELFHLLNPMTHTRTDHEVREYKGEPYVMAADVYTADPHKGQAGWTWYTGASGWMYQAGLEGILGIKRRGDILYIDPCIPEDWPEYSLSYRYGESSYQIKVIHQKGGSKQVLTVDNEVKEFVGTIPSVLLINDGEKHNVELYLSKN
ncbi:GH36-type glycosyl hydrolase domain-containing protein [Salipaludibacillus daqingensis]|uniref:GH36-type glycosyl hydrolase domain-containing protein n=1 Tax=Salipaludibacillus daqingensis TaxID=3041001 RepID=UPI002475E3A2|nr:glucoamylase family protein [Salipaludibacillus daqingensis]